MNQISGIHGAICVAVYRPVADLLRRQLESIAAQELTAWECHVGIDGRDPEVAALVRSIVGSDERFHLHEFDDNVGFYRNFERTIAAAVATADEWVALADQDDYWYPEKLKTLVRSFEVPEVMAVTGRARLVNKYGDAFGIARRRETSLVELLLNNQVTGSASIFRRSVIDEAMPFPEPTDAAYHDHWLGVVARAMGTVVVSSSLVQDYVQHDRNVLGEEHGGRLLRRLHALWASGPRRRDLLRYVATQRWGWRVSMASRLVSSGTDAPDIRAVARGRVCVRLLRTIGCAIIRRRLPITRGAALLVGALGWSLYRLDTVPGVQGTGLGEARERKSIDYTQ